MKKVEQTLAITLRRLCTSPFWCFTTTKAKISNSRCKWMRKNNSNNKMHWTIFCLMNVQAHNEHQLYFSIKKVEVMSSQHCTQHILKQSPMVFSQKNAAIFTVYSSTDFDFYCKHQWSDTIVTCWQFEMYFWLVVPRNQYAAGVVLCVMKNIVLLLLLSYWSEIQ